MKITYTFTDESPALASYSLLPIIKALLSGLKIDLEVVDISLANRILAAFPEISGVNFDSLAYLGELVKRSDANLIKTPNISASIPQLKAAIAEMQSKGFNLPDFPDSAQNEEEEKIQKRYKTILGSAVNPVLRDGNSNRKSTFAVKSYAQRHPYQLTPFNPSSKTRISSMREGDFYANEKAILIERACEARVEFVSSDNTQILKRGIFLESGEVVDASFMDVEKLYDFYKEQREICKSEEILFSLHLKATMMKVSDPILFGYGVKAFLEELFLEFAQELEDLEINPNNGISELLAKIENSPKRDAILQKYQEILNAYPISMVDNSKTTLHVPSDVIIDASMPAMLKNGAKLWGKFGEQSANAIIPDRTYSGVYAAVLEDMRRNGVLNPSQIGSVSNIGLMAKKAQEYGSHDKTFVAASDGEFRLVSNERVLLSHKVKKGDIYRINQAKKEAIYNWIDLGILESKKEGVVGGIFWLDKDRPSDEIIIKIVESKIKNESKIKILSPKEACKESLGIIREGKNVVSITGNVLRDYLTDLFPILELGTSAKMLSIVPMLNGGAMFETGAGGSAPKQVAQLVEENHLRWDSLGDFLALQASIEFYAQKNNHSLAANLARSLDSAILQLLDNDKSPKRDVKSDDNRTSHFYLLKFLLSDLAKKHAEFLEISEELEDCQSLIYQDFIKAQGVSVDLGGYYKFDDAKAQAIMCPSARLNKILEKISNLEISSSN